MHFMAVEKSGTSSGMIDSYLFLRLFYFKQYSVSGAQFSKAGLNGALMKKKETTLKTNKDKKECFNNV